MKKYTNSELLREISSSKNFCDDLNRALECIPENSLLGRLGITASLKREQKRYNNLMTQARARGLVK